LSSVPPCQFGSLTGLEHGRTIPFSDIGQLMIRRAAMGSGATRLDGGKTLHFL
jgi:hypothetical protein